MRLAKDCPARFNDVLVAELWLNPITLIRINSYFKGDIAELVIFSKFLNTEERQAVEAYIMKKWSIK
jgi:hypothetical protein